MSYKKSMYICPFCSYYGKVIEFRITLENGSISRKRFRCPCCKNVMMERTLKKRMTIKQWAEWMYLSIRQFNDPKNKFYDRIPFPLLLENLKKIHVASEFWSAWDEIKSSYYSLGLDEIKEKLEAGTMDIYKGKSMSNWLYDKCPNCGSELVGENEIFVFFAWDSKKYIDGCDTCFRDNIGKMENVRTH